MTDEWPQLFDDIAEQEHVFALFDELASQPNQRAATKFRVQDSLLLKRLYVLAIKIHDLEKEHGFAEHVTSFQRSRVGYLIDKLESSDRADKLGVALPEIRELLLQAWAISLQMLCGTMTPLADKAKAQSSGGKKGHERAYGTKSDKEKKRKEWQDLIDSAAAEHPDWSFERIKSHVAKNNSGFVSESQLKRYTKNPRKKS